MAKIVEFENALRAPPAAAVLVAALLVSGSAASAAGAGRAGDGDDVRDLETVQVVEGDAGSAPTNRGGGGRAHTCLDHDPPGHAKGRERRCGAPPASGGVARGDFNGDGYGDLSIGVPKENIGALADAGAVQVVYGSPNGLTAANQLIHEDMPNVAGVAEEGDEFGTALAAGNFNGDAFSDLAIGIPGADNSGLVDNGLVLVLLGSANGLVTTGQRQLAQGQNGLQGTLESYDRFGETLVWGRFDPDPYGDLAIGAPGEDVGSVSDAGAVSVVYGSSVGPIATGGPGNQLWHQDVAGIESAAEDGDDFGASLAAGDFDGNGSQDLAVGVPNEGLVNASTGEPFPHAGAVNVIYGGTTGLTAGGSDFLVEHAPVSYTGRRGYYEVGVQAHGHFGLSLAAGDLDALGQAELIVGVPYGDIEFCFDERDAFTDCFGNPDAGWVVIFDGGGGGLDRGRFSRRLSPGAGAGDPIDAVDAELFGWAIVVGDFDGGGDRVPMRRELAIGAPGFDSYELNIGTFGQELGPTDTGAVFVDASSSSSSWSRTWCDASRCHHRSLSLIAAEGDRLGESLTAWDLTGDRASELVIGVPHDDFRSGGVSLTDAGMLHVVYGSPSNAWCDSANPCGLDPSRQHTLFQGGPIASTSGVLQGTAESGDEFGSTLY